MINFLIDLGIFLLVCDQNFGLMHTKALTYTISLFPVGTTLQYFIKNVLIKYLYILCNFNFTH